MHELVNHCTSFRQIGYSRIPFPLQLLRHFLKMGINTSELLLDDIGAFFEIATDIAHSYPYLRPSVVGASAEVELMAVLWLERKFQRKTA